MQVAPRILGPLGAPIEYDEYVAQTNMLDATSTKSVNMPRDDVDFGLLEPLNHAGGPIC